MWLKKMIKRHSLRESPLYRLLGKERFKKIVGIPWEAAERIISQDNYHVFAIGNEKKRDIQSPLDPLSSVHVRIGKLLSRIEVPDYVYSQAGRSCIDKALLHIGIVSRIKIDIKQFYKSTKRQMVYQMFRRDFECSKGIASCLADLCCYRQEFLPTGSPLSGFVAFFAAKNMFDELANLAERKKSKMSIFVDDIVFSGENATGKIVDDIYGIIRQHGYNVNKKKTKVSAPHSPMMITGIVVHQNRIFPPHKRYKKIQETEIVLAQASLSKKDRSKFEDRLRGRRQEVRRVLAVPFPVEGVAAS